MINKDEMVSLRRDTLERILHSARATGIPETINDEACAALAAPAEDVLAVAEEPVVTFELKHDSTGEVRNVSFTGKEVYDGMTDTVYEKLNLKLCGCESVGETNVVDCNCWDYTDDFDLVGILSSQRPIVPLDPVHGDVLPAIGSTVQIQLGDRGWFDQTVTGYYVWPNHGQDKNVHRVFVRVKDAAGTSNARLLNDIRQPAPTTPQ